MPTLDSFSCYECSVYEHLCVYKQYAILNKCGILNTNEKVCNGTCSACITVCHSFRLFIFCPTGNSFDLHLDWSSLNSLELQQTMCALCLMFFCFLFENKHFPCTATKKKKCKCKNRNFSDQFRI